LEPVWETLKALLEQPSYVCEQLRQAMTQEIPQQTRAEEGAEIENKLTALAVQKQRWAQAYAADPTMSVAFYTRQIQACTAQEHRLQARREQVRHAEVSAQDLDDLVHTIQQLYARVQTGVATASAETKQQVIRLLVHKVVVYAKENRARVELKFPDLSACSSSDFTVQDFQLRDRIPEARLAKTENPPLRDTNLRTRLANAKTAQWQDMESEPHPATRPALALTVQLVSVTERRQMARLNNPAMQKKAG